MMGCHCPIPLTLNRPVHDCPPRNSQWNTKPLELYQHIADWDHQCLHCLETIPKDSLQNDNVPYMSLDCICGDTYTDLYMHHISKIKYHVYIFSV